MPVVAAAVAVSATGCGLGDKQAIADRLHASRLAVAEASPAVGTVTYELRQSSGGSDAAAQLAALAGEAGAVGAPTTSAQIVLDGRDRRARVSLPSVDGAVERTTTFDDTELFVRRQNARATERRTWARLDLGKIVEDERPLALREMTPPSVLNAVVTTVNPVYLLELVEGALAGSVERKGNDLIGETAVTRHVANISFDKALTGLDFDDEEREVRLRLFRLLGASKDVVPAELWLDAEGRLRRLRIELEQRVDRQRSIDLIVTLELAAFGDATSLEGPADESVVTYERFGRLVRSAMPEEA